MFDFPGELLSAIQHQTLQGVLVFPRSMQTEDVVAIGQRLVTWDTGTRAKSKKTRHPLLLNEAKSPNCLQHLRSATLWREFQTNDVKQLSL